jgi:hypothetical protein
MGNNSKARDRDRPTTLVFQDNTVPRDNGVLHREMKGGESTQLREVTTKDGLVKIVRPRPSISSRTCKEHADAQQPHLVITEETHSPEQRKWEPMKSARNLLPMITIREKGTRLGPAPLGTGMTMVRAPFDAVTDERCRCSSSREPSKERVSSLMFTTE